MDISIVIVVLAGIAGVLAIIVLGTRHEERKLELENGAGNAEKLGAMNAEMNAEIARLKDRVNVLERLATSDDRKLSEEIGRLGSRVGAPNL